jgi:hypothetical protein
MAAVGGRYLRAGDDQPVGPGQGRVVGQLALQPGQDLPGEGGVAGVPVVGRGGIQRPGQAAAPAAIGAAAGRPRRDPRLPKGRLVFLLGGYGGLMNKGLTVRGAQMHGQR